MSLFAVDEKDGTADFVAVGEDRHIDERQGGSLVPAVVGVERARMIATRSFVVGVVVLHELRRIVGQRVNHTAGTFVAAVAGINGTLFVQLLFQFVALVGVHAVVIAVGVYAAHVVHR